MHEALGEDNAEIVEKAMACIENGNVEELGHLMTVAQQNLTER